MKRETKPSRRIRMHIVLLGKNWKWWSHKIEIDYSNYIQAVVEEKVKFAIGTHAHNKRLAHNQSGKGIGWFQAKSSLSCFGTTEETVALLRKYGIDERNLWIPHLGRVMK